MDLFTRIIECKEEEVDSIIEEAIKYADFNAEKIGQLGFINSTESNSVFKGFIPLKTRIKYSNNTVEDYGMETTDFIYEFAHFIRKNSINTKVLLIHSLEYFINSYFGYHGRITRENIFNDIAWEATKDSENPDDDYFRMLANNKIGDLKGKGAAECTERGALAQQILSIFGTETYYCMGAIECRGRREGHCFNIVKTRDSYALLDYSMAITSFNKDGSVAAFFPFIGELSNEAFLDFINNGVIKDFDDYEIIDKVKTKTGVKRSYIVGKYEMERDNSKNQ